MKRKIVIGVLALAMVMPMSACSSKTEDKAQTNVSQSDDKQKTESSDTAEKGESSDEINEYGLTGEQTETLCNLVKEKVTEQYLNKYNINPADFTFPEYVPANWEEVMPDNMWAYVEGSLKLLRNGTVYDLPPIVMVADTAGYKETGIKEIRKAISEGAFAFKDSWQEQNDVFYQWFVENNSQQGDLIGAVYEGIAEFLNGLDEDTRAEVLYDTCLKNVIEPGEDEQGRDLHTTFDQVLCKNVAFE